jgi:dCTP diphosphatase
LGVDNARGQDLSEIEDLKRSLRDFYDVRDWKQFHTPKNLAMALAGEAGELLSEFQWLTPEESELASLSNKQIDAIRLEVADVFLYLVSLADALSIDIFHAASEKILINESRFPHRSN